ncbi:glycoside hydrolase family 16 protein [Neolentinus lepideus HHB14362 ss-1]|uniref:Glycoside hydrolase family 16 protein n=1 Tax=Neolentinus lepideus HHB14362 ss-1 TaxID=1314782 RepID=A0A165P544_9AGAM|nr:glycoside hydrolase family 16 protein [Neolentinus lepideus HHB14362 ss-1]
MAWTSVRLVLAIGVPVVVQAATYTLSDNIVGAAFNDFFQYEAIADPSHGRVNYVDQATAQRKNLTYAHDDTFILRADYTTYLSASGPGRDSVRLQSSKTYTTHVAVFDIRHMPQGCATWPAVWEVGADWPNEGEIDIIEGVNGAAPNQVTLHTGTGCSMPSARAQTGTTTTTSCASSNADDSGCGVRAAGDLKDASFGAGFNAGGGGWYALERTPSTLKIWFWPRSAGGVPGDVRGGGAVDTGAWGTPLALFPSSAQCDMESHLGPMSVIINLTFCGDWAGAAYAHDGCPGSCVDHVNTAPSAFASAYFDFAGVRIYE